MSVKSREVLEETVEKALRDGGDFDPNGVDAIVGRIVDALLVHGPGSTGEAYRAGWLLACGRVHQVVETDRQDGCYVVYTRDTDPDYCEEGDEE